MDTKKTNFNNRKFRGAILYLLANSSGATIEGKKKLAKLLYFADFNFFEAFEKPFTGATYRALPMGPVPQELDAALAELEGREIKIKRKSIGLQNDMVVYSLNTKPEELVFDFLTEQEKKVLDKVVRDYGKLNGKTLENITHSEAPYNAVAPGEHIPYELAFYRGKTAEELLGV
jgi:uncharacterized phage-associated protein